VNWPRSKLFLNLYLLTNYDSIFLNKVLDEHKIKFNVDWNCTEREGGRLFGLNLNQLKAEITRELEYTLRK
jgi:hypothetical protein